MEDLNDYVYFTQVVTHGGFAAAGRALQVPKSKLSRRIAALEERLGARLIERSSHRFQVTDPGRAFYQRCQAMLMEAERAKAVVCEAKMLPGFLARYPRVQLQMLATDRRVALVDERVHVAIRTRITPETETELKMRVLAQLSLFAIPAQAKSLILNDVNRKGLHYRA